MAKLLATVRNGTKRMGIGEFPPPSEVACWMELVLRDCCDRHPEHFDCTIVPRSAKALALINGAP